MNGAGGEGKSENNPCDGDVLMLTVMHGCRHEYTPIPRLVLAIAFTTIGSGVNDPTDVDGSGGGSGIGTTGNVGSVKGER